MAQLLANSKIGDKQIASEEFVNNKVKTDVPVNAKFTDTTYTEITEAEINTGTASDLRTITARRITYILNKAQALINSAISALTKSSVGLGNVDNVKQASKTEFDTHNSDSTRHITSSERMAWNAKGSSNLALGETSATAYRGDMGKTAYDHSQTAHAPSTAQKNSDITKAEIEAKLTGVITTHSHTVTKADVVLGNVDNVKQIPFSEKGANNGVAELDSAGKVLSSQLPSYVDDVLNYTTQSNFPATGESGKIYITEDTNKTYRWTGSAYVEISPSIALGETSATAYRGDRGKVAYDHSQVAHAPSTAQKNSDITKAEIEAKLTGTITTHTHDYVPTNSFKGSTFTANVIPLDNPLGSFRVATASNATTYTLSTTKVIGAWAKILVNRATAPTVTGGTLIKGSDFKASTNMYLYVMYDGTKSEYYFAEI